jgi:type I restriction enzyme, S subunit
MAVKAGYKQTEIGVIPEEWNVVKAGEIGRFRGGNGFPLKFQGQKTGTYPFYKVSDMNNEGNEIFMFDANNWLSEQSLSQIGATLFPADSIVFAKVGAAVFLERKKILSRPSCIDNNVAAFFIDKSKAEVRFIHYLMLNIKLGDFANATALPSLSGTNLSQILFCLPSLPEQQAIAAALSDVDQLIASLDQLIEKRRALKTAAMQQLLTGKTRLAGFSGEWEAKRLGEIAKCYSGGTPHTDNASYYNGTIPWITSGDLNKGYVDYVNASISHEGLSHSAAKMVEPNTLLLALYGATAGVVAITNIAGAINQAVLAIIPINQDVYFLYSYFSLLKEWLIATYTQGGQPNLSGQIIKSVALQLPTLPEQKAIAEVLSDMDAEITELEQRRDKTQAIKQGMMQELLTGRTRLI